MNNVQKYTFFCVGIRYYKIDFAFSCQFNFVGNNMLHIYTYKYITISILFQKEARGFKITSCFFT